MKCKLCGEETEDDKIVDLGEGRVELVDVVICEKCFIDITKQGIKEMVSGIESGIIDTILDELL